MDGDTVSFQGYLERKLRPSVCNLWKKQWFVLGGKTFAYYKSKEQYERDRQKPAGLVNFYFVQAVQVVNCPCKEFAFDVVTRSRTIHLAAMDKESYQNWVETLQQALLRPIISEPIVRSSVELPIDESVAERFSDRRSQPKVPARVRSLESFYALEPPPVMEDRTKSLSYEVLDMLLTLHPEYASSMTFTEDYF